jgi:hypothetical protein
MGYASGQVRLAQEVFGEGANPDHEVQSWPDEKLCRRWDELATRLFGDNP